MATIFSQTVSSNADSSLFSVNVQSALTNVFGELGITLTPGNNALEADLGDGLTYKVSAALGLPVFQQLVYADETISQNSNQLSNLSDVEFLGISIPELTIVRITQDGDIWNLGLLRPTQTIAMKGRKVWLPYIKDASLSAFKGSDSVENNKRNYQRFRPDVEVSGTNRLGLPYVDRYARTGVYLYASADIGAVALLSDDILALGASGLSFGQIVEAGGNNYVVVGTGESGLAIRSPGGTPTTSVNYFIQTGTAEILYSPQLSPPRPMNMSTVPGFWKPDKLGSYGETLYFTEAGDTTITMSDYRLVKTNATLFDSTDTYGWTAWEVCAALSQLDTAGFIDASTVDFHDGIYIYGYWGDIPPENWTVQQWKDHKEIANPTHWLFHCLRQESNLNSGSYGDVTIDDAFLAKWGCDWEFIAKYLHRTVEKENCYNFEFVTSPPTLTAGYLVNVNYSALSPEDIMDLRSLVGTSQYLLMALYNDRAKSLDYDRLESYWGLTRAQIENSTGDLEENAIFDFRFDSVALTYNPAIASISNPMLEAIQSALNVSGKFFFWLFDSSQVLMSTITTRFGYTDERAFQILRQLQRGGLLTFQTALANGDQIEWNGSYGEFDLDQGYIWIEPVTS